MLELTTYALYLSISVSLTIWVGRTLFHNGRIFLVDAFHGNQQMADSVNQLLKIGFYLLNIGFVGLFLNTGVIPQTNGQMIKQLSWQIGVVMLVLGAIHLLNMKNIAGMRSRALSKRELYAAQEGTAPSA